MTEASPFKTGLKAEEGFPKAGLLERFLAKFIDFLIMGALFAFPTAVGPLAGTTYILISDGLNGGQSIGKKIIGLKVISAREFESHSDFKMSIMRNSVFAFPVLWHYIIGWIPYLGAVLTFLGWATVMGIEIALIYADEFGARFGDRIAGTYVVPAKSFR